ncbi:SIMPL domain-containing protein [Sphingomonas sp. HITSZ_GF]|uniref:SIMPL domain-containing protein n=1 Tax=Sphingomonas sp. HITSZ_GF TaxID=3037247 RepID=UPI00240D6287|nr:SIMPL domain-containing protein [Sphingomonas sp. HITSZ_GF]MDG2533448.1 SIMPL domain-containing protein [Sphingomonas sp. HITSZ_GF]
MIRIALATTAALVAVSALPAAAQQEARAVPLDGTVLDVSATGSSTRVPDLAVIQAGVVTQAATAAEAMQQNNAQMTKVLAALRGAGVAERDIQTARISLSPQYRYAENKPSVITGYQASNQVSIRFRDVAKSGSILDALVREGANDISGPNLTIDKPDSALDEARVDAVKKARARAELYAQAAGLRVDRILAISESGALPPMPAPVMMRAQAGMVADKLEVVAGERELNVTVSVRFLLK